MTAGTLYRERWAMGVEARALMLVTAVLTAFGLATLFSASALVALQRDLPATTFFFQQLTGVAAGVVVFAIAAKVDAQRYERLAWPIMLLAIALMLLTLVPGVGSRIGGSKRFLLEGSVQPAELAKIAVVIWTSALVLRKAERMRRLSRGMPLFLGVVGLLIAIAFVQPDLSMGLMFALLMGLVLFAANVRIGHFVVVGILAAPVLWHELQQRHYALARIWSFIGSEKALQQISEQQYQSLIAVGSGGLAGTGFGEGRQQFGWVPMGMDDFIASTIGEEWGFLGFTLVILAFALYTWLGFRIARNARTPFLKLVAIGLTATVAITAYVHIGVVINLLPNTGLTLPFFSNGRSNLVLTFLITGILVNIGSVRERVYGTAATDPLVAAGP
jgi:cell division protein FtsW